ncbi:hypothetical protein VE04_05125 [Pseudogymnoascus sp. 24MN13]|nr:hypothetical protein VE04_05125 [Pseudogymnoascus sp. 24MN13]
MSAEEFLADAEGGKLPVDCHDRVLQIAFIYMDEGLWKGNGVFDVVEKLHARGWSFGEGELKFNRTLDIFYLAQLAAAIYRSSSQLNGDFPSPSDFPAFYATHRALLHPSAWRSYYSATFLTQRTSARFYRLPDLQDLPDSSSPLGQPGQRLALTAAAAQRHETPPLGPQPLSTLEASAARLRAVQPSVPPYSETQARFWLEHMKLGAPRPSSSAKEAWKPNGFGVLVAQGAFDVCAWEGKYSAQLWEGEVGSEEEVEFLAAVAVEETVGVEVGELDFAVRSHVFLGVMRGAVEGVQEREVFLEELKRGMVAKGRIAEERAGRWLREALAVVEPVCEERREGARRGAEEREKVLQRILVENGQLFARWKVSLLLNEFNFELGARE